MPNKLELPKFNYVDSGEGENTVYNVEVISNEHTFETESGIPVASIQVIEVVVAGLTIRLASHYKYMDASISVSYMFENSFLQLSERETLILNYILVEAFSRVLVNLSVIMPRGLSLVLEAHQETEYFASYRLGLNFAYEENPVPQYQGNTTVAVANQPLQGIELAIVGDETSPSLVESNVMLNRIYAVEAYKKALEEYREFLRNLIQAV